jgi:hypothetical protein
MGELANPACVSRSLCFFGTVIFTSAKGLREIRNWHAEYRHDAIAGEVLNDAPKKLSGRAGL